MLFMNPGDTLNKPSSIGFAARISQKAQVEINLFPEWYLGGNLYHIEGGIKYIRWPADYYGLGNGSDIPKDSADGYLAQGVDGDLTVERELFRNFSAGPQALFKYETIESKGHRDLLTDTVPGHEGGFTSGLGLVMTYDGRDAIYWARSGTYLSAKAAWYQSMWGSEFDYDHYVLQASQFLPLFSTGALGLSATLEATAGDVPFRDLPTADGDHSLRGIVRGKYRDRDLLLLQSEYKSYFPDWSWMSHPWFRNRIGYAVFAEAGQVAHVFGDLDWSEFRPAYGVGLRYAMNPAQRMNIRIDLGFVDGTVAPAINIKEAF
jgi:outer membrane protein assembly factor BamA